MALDTEESAAAPHPSEVGVTVPLEKLSLPGCFVFHRTGELLRVPEDAITPGRRTVVDIVSKDSWLITRISTDPYLPLNTARTLAVDMDLPVDF